MYIRWEITPEGVLNIVNHYKRTNEKEDKTMDENKLKRDFNWKTLLLFAVPTIALNLWLGVYQLINSAISSSMINTDALAAIDICYPILSVEEGLAAMLGAGACAVIGKKLGEGKIKEACSNLTIVTLFGAIITAVYLALVFVFRHLFWKLLVQLKD